MIFNVRISSSAEKDLSKVPIHIAEKLFYWIRIVKLEGLENTRLIKGYHDEPLKGKRKGQRSIRLSRSYRAIYSIQEEKVKIIFIEEVNKHEY
jgi:toxin HigB-1